MSLEDNFWGEVRSDTRNVCWPWLGGRNKAGYGVTTVRGKRELAHRLAFELHSARKPNGLILHSCDNPPCCNPQHLREGTHADNMGDKMSRNRQAKGELCGSNRFSRGLIDALRFLHATEKLSPRELAALCRHVPDKSYIQKVVNGEVWKWCATSIECAAELTTNMAFATLREHARSLKPLKKTPVPRK